MKQMNFFNSSGYQQLLISTTVIRITSRVSANYGLKLLSKGERHAVTNVTLEVEKRSLKMNIQFSVRNVSQNETNYRVFIEHTHDTVSKHKTK